MAGSVLLAPLGGILLWQNPIGHPGWRLVLTTIVVHICYFVLLGRGYTRAIYP